MKMRTVGKTILYTAGFLVLAALAIAQAPATSKTVKPRDAASGQASGREASSGMASGRRQNKPLSAHEDPNVTPTNSEATDGAATASEAASQASGRKSGMVNAADFKKDLNAKSSGHATESLAVSDGASSSDPEKSTKTSNPLYQQSGNSGENPLFEPKDKTVTAPKPNANAPETVEYKDGEDRNTRYRPGNNKTTKTADKNKGAATPPLR
jgi:hypothetical protein